MSISTTDERNTVQKLNLVKLKKKKRKKNKKCAQKKERKATQTLAIVLGNISIPTNKFFVNRFMHL